MIKSKALGESTASYNFIFQGGPGIAAHLLLLHL